MALRRTTTSHPAGAPAGVDQPDEQHRPERYVPPRLERLGSLSELTLGGKGDPDDGHGGAGDEGSV